MRRKFSFILYREQKKEKKLEEKRKILKMTNDLFSQLELAIYK